MRIITRQNRIKASIEHQLNWLSAMNGDVKPIGSDLTIGEILSRLKKVNPETCTVEELMATGLTENWTKLVCTSCRTDHQQLVVFHNSWPNFASPKEVMVCAECLTAASKFLVQSSNQG